MLYVQAWGRGITASPGKTDCLFLDHAGNVQRLGMLTEINSDVLDDGEGQRSAERQPDKGEAHDLKLCPECQCVQAPKARECPQCGYVFYAVTLVRETDEELVELGQLRKKTTEIVEANRQRTQWYSGLLFIAEQRGYKRGWAAHQFKERFGSWPNFFATPQAETPSLEVRNWVRSRQIAFAKARQRYG